ncbi:MAG: recombination regulator RecX [Pseudohongiellaceae bacterium]
MADEQPIIDVPVLRRAAMDCLARREHSLLELTQKLRRKFPDADSGLIEQTLATLEEDNLQSDARFVESFVRYRQSRGFGLLHIQADLKSRGISDQLLGQNLHQDDDLWQELANDLVQRKIGDQAVVFGGRAHRRLLRFLQSRGFSSDQIRNAVDPHLSFSSKTQAGQD